MPVVRELAVKASKADVHFTIDAEEADRLELQMDVFEALLADEISSKTAGAASELRSKLIRSVRRRCATGLSSGSQARRRLMVRLVKGAYWDTEIKARRSAGLPTIRCSRARSRPTSPTLPAPRSCWPRATCIYPAFATHNANTIGAGEGARGSQAEFEFQRLHGMGEELYEELAELEESIGDARTPVRSTRRSAAIRNCSPIWSAGCSRTAPTPVFVNRIADEQVSLDELVRDPVAELDALDSQAQSENRPARRELFGAAAQQRRGRPQPTHWCASRCWSA